MAIAATIRLQHSNEPDTESSGRGIPNYLGPAVLSPDGVNAWTPSKQDNIARGVLRDGNQLTFDSAVRSIASHLNLSNNTEDYAGRIDFNNGGIASTGVFDRFGTTLFVALEGSREVVVVDAHGKRERFRLDVGFAPQGLTLSPDSTRLYVNNFMSRTVSVFDVNQVVNAGAVSAPLVATWNAVATERLTAQVLNGKRLFYDAADPRLARDAYISCAACHNDGGQDGRVWDFTGFGEGLRNTTALGGRAGAQGFQHWSGNFDEIQDFEGQIRNFAGGTGLMTDAQFNTGTRSQPLGDRKSGVSVDLDALAAYVASLNSFARSPYRANGALTADAVAGRDVFRTANCAQCHGGAAFTDSAAANLRDIGTIKASSGSRLGAALTGLDTQTLRDVWATAPYLHDGSAATLADAVTAHRGVSLTATNLNQLVAYLQQIGSEETTAPANNQSPTVTLTAPANNATFTAPAAITLTANAADADGTVARVEFYNGATKLGEDATSPYSFAWTNVAAGTYSVSARAVDNAGAATFSAAANVKVNAPTMVYVSDLTPTSQTNGWGPYERDRSNGERGAADGRTITLNGVTYAKGLGCHAASDLRFNLNAQYQTFLSDIGLDDEVGANGSVVFQVWVDGVRVYDSGVMRGSTATKQISFNVAGKRELRLVVTSGGDNLNYDHADWANARLVR
jgi:mono/diheme cytochrome c family protein